MRYAGQVYDGPLQGQHRESNSPFFYAQRCDPTQIAANGPGAIVNVQVTAELYHWSHSLRAWVFGGA